LIGVWEPDFELASFQIGEPVSEQDLALFEDRIVLLDEGKWWIPSFVSFQYGKLSENCRPHIPIIAALKKSGLYRSVSQNECYRHPLGPGIRKRVIERDGMKCFYSGKTLTENEVEIDHIVPKSSGGSNTIDNLVVCDAALNLRKMNKPLGQFCQEEGFDLESILAKIKGIQQNNKGYLYPLQRVQEKDQDQDKEKEEDQDLDGGMGEDAKVMAKTRRQEIARPILHYLNEKAVRRHRESHDNLVLIAARMAEVGDDADGVRRMIDRMVAKWKGDTEMNDYLRPATLFGKQKFQGYYDDRDLPVLSAGRKPPESNQIQEDIQIKILN
jgi:uncharacterized phage protein (TIGR02220 family)